MSEPAWTPGPWLKVTTGNVGNLIETADGGIVGHFQAPHWGPTREEVAQANGNLMAAAPELYDALNNALAFIAAWAGNYQAASGLPDLHPIHAEQIAKTQAALAKAEGRQP